MRDEQKVFDLMRETSSSIYPLAQEIMSEPFEKNFTERRFYLPILIGSGLAPNPITVELYSKRTPYSNPSGIENLLEDMASAGYLGKDSNGGYLLSEKGVNAINSTNDTFYKHLNKVDQFPADKRKELTALLSKLVEACKQADLSNNRLSFDISNNGHPQVEPDSLAQIDQHIDDINAFRDDAHISAWTPSGVNGHTWETLSFVWNGEANTVEKLVESLPFRNYTAEDFTNTLNNLTERGWIEPGDDGYKITDVGKKIREDAEDATNENFFTPWKSLSDDELAKLEELLGKLKEINEKIVEESKTE
ncbi:MAG TPA: MarR family winged helix-turn-helix transcriptional regulator [Anaerolineales bacterium]|nr:MarR family winged helix-turn-helix transcriptional regulator [Anaerolineales bacterium]